MTDYSDLVRRLDDAANQRLTDWMADHQYDVPDDRPSPPTFIEAEAADAIRKLSATATPKIWVYSIEQINSNRSVFHSGISFYRNSAEEVMQYVNLMYYNLIEWEERGDGTWVGYAKNMKLNARVRIIVYQLFDMSNR